MSDAVPGASNLDPAKSGLSNPGRGASGSAASPILREAAHAKVNLYLHVTGKREDGYHLLDSLAVFAGCADGLSAAPSGRMSLAIEGPFGDRLPPDDPDNLVLRAASLLAAPAAPGLALVLDKHLPVASGIGGGSADAAAALRLLRRAWSLEAELDEQRLHDLATRLGADVPVCLAQRPARMRGIGERLEPVPALPDIGMMLVNCGEAVATRDVFRVRAAPFSPEAELPQAELPQGGTATGTHAWPDAAALVASLSRLTNDLQAPACRICPAIADVLGLIAGLPGCLLARMSGSGATCFGLFANPQAARRARDAARMPEHWWAWAGGLHRPA